MVKKSCHQTKTCRSTAVAQSSRVVSWWTVALMAVLPKCPFCVMAYSGAVSLCSGTMLYPNADAYMAVGMLVISILVALGIVWNYRDRRTWGALLLALLGIAFVAHSQFITPSESTYYIGVLLLFFGVWFNGSFFHFYYKIFNNKIKPIQKRTL